MTPKPAKDIGRALNLMLEKERSRKLGSFKGMKNPLWAQEHAYQLLEAQVRHVHAMNAHSLAYLEILKGLGEELARVQNSTDGTALMLALKATAAADVAGLVRYECSQPALPGVGQGS
ncbi:hypothetical protein HPB52_010415 [Rhipicephalus sanguineus]|uniref:Uncharacterized protein n=1 Tax=Rhipicephalus sanguineus TaxID=34632 RepID=A0A9D4Q088_RHISA|nr:hypothetical protein HPB52_010415 [Rhipicephalus sanguineus]